jgi:hypothetical protein
MIRKVLMERIYVAVNWHVRFGKEIFGEDDVRFGKKSIDENNYNWEILSQIKLILSEGPYLSNVWPASTPCSTPMTEETY